MWMPKPIVAIALYEMKNLRLKPGGAKNSTTKRKPALMEETQKIFEEQIELEKNAGLCPYFFFQGSNNQNKVPTHRM
jgi:hypothetical protein